MIVVLHNNKCLLFVSIGFLKFADIDIDSHSSRRIESTKQSDMSIDERDLSENTREDNPMCSCPVSAPVQIKRRFSYLERIVNYLGAFIGRDQDSQYELLTQFYREDRERSVKYEDDLSIDDVLSFNLDNATTFSRNRMKEVQSNTNSAINRIKSDIAVGCGCNKGNCKCLSECKCG